MAKESSNSSSSSSTLKQQKKKEGERGGGWSAVAWAAGLLFAWTALELAFKPWLDAGRSAIRKSLDPNYDVDDELDQAPLPSSSSSQQQQQTDRIHGSDGDDNDDDKDAVDSHKRAS